MSSQVITMKLSHEVRVVIQYYSLLQDTTRSTMPFTFKSFTHGHIYSTSALVTNIFVTNIFVQLCVRGYPPNTFVKAAIVKSCCSQLGRQNLIPAASLIPPSLILSEVSGTKKECGHIFRALCFISSWSNFIFSEGLKLVNSYLAIVLIYVVHHSYEDIYTDTM